MINPAIVVIAYNRADSLKRLLGSLSKAYYPADENITLIISIDKGDNAGVIKIANDFVWSYGDKKVVRHEINLGLKKHVIECGDYTEDYGSIIVLEDDLYVSPVFYYYATQALEFLELDSCIGKSVDRIAGISLYNHLFNVNVREPFYAIDDGYDNYYLQLASSWGQVYTRIQWNEFKEWLKVNDNKDLRDTQMPEFISSWSDKSWLKYYIKYMIENDKYFIYPRVSLTTNFSDEGTHESESVTTFQVPMSGVFSLGNRQNEAVKRKYHFSTIDDSMAVYDPFFENARIKEHITLDDVEVDLYGYKPVSSKRYLLSSKSYPYKILKSYGRIMRPIDANVFNDVDGSDFFLYDTESSASEPVVSEAKKVMYNYRALNFARMKKLIGYRILGK